MRVVLALGAVLAGLQAVACGSTVSCTYMVEPLDFGYEATLPASIDPATSKIEVCLAGKCGSTPLRDGCGPITGVGAGDTRCTYDAATRKLAFQTPSTGGTNGEPLVVTAEDPSGARTDILKGTVSYERQEDCTGSSQGTFTPTP